MENFNQFLDLDFKTQYVNKDLSKSVEELKFYIDKLNHYFAIEQYNFANICFYIYKVKQLFSDYTKSWYGGFETKKARYTFDSIMRGFGIDETQVSRILKVYEKFIVFIDDEPRIKESFYGFSKSKLFELLIVDDGQLELDIKNKIVRSDMPVRLIREYVKNYQAIQKQKAKLNEPQKEEEKEEFNEEDIPAVYNPKQHYEFSYFEDKTKAQLLNMIWDLQKEYEKLKKEVKKNGNSKH